MFGNLEWCTCKENMLHASQNNLLNHKSISKHSVEHHSSIAVIQYDKFGNFIKKWDCISDVTRQLNISASTISACCKHKKHYYSAGGFKWEYAN